jgi:hypothetical protein
VDARDTPETVRGEYKQASAIDISQVWDIKEIKPGMIELMRPKFTFAQNEFQDGDVVCFQVDLPDKEWAIIVWFLPCD